LEMHSKLQPMDLFNKYKDIYAESFIINPKESDNGYSVVMTEKDRSATLRRVTVFNVPKDTILLSMQDYSEMKHGNKMKSILKPGPGIFRCCDYVLISVYEKKIYLIFIEMKSSVAMTSGVDMQFKGASCILEYCHAIIEHFYDMPSIRLSTLDTRYVFIYGVTSDKRPTKNRGYGNISTPSAYIKIRLPIRKNAGSIRFSALLE